MEEVSAQSRGFFTFTTGPGEGGDLTVVAPMRKPGAAAGKSQFLTPSGSGGIDESAGVSGSATGTRALADPRGSIRPAARGAALACLPDSVSPPTVGSPVSPTPQSRTGGRQDARAALVRSVPPVRRSPFPQPSRHTSI